MPAPMSAPEMRSLRTVSLLRLIVNSANPDTRIAISIESSVTWTS
jgi:hypothetical protein